MNAGLEGVGVEMSLLFYRLGHRLHAWGVPGLPKLCTIMGQIVFGSYIPAECSIGKNVKVAYGGAGLVIHRRAKIGDGCLLSPGVVIGGRAGYERVPNIGAGVKLFPGAKVLGPITIGDEAIIGANAVVVDNVANNQVMLAVKATRLHRDDG